jgi:hypothetical protein
MKITEKMHPFKIRRDLVGISAQMSNPMSSADLKQVQLSMPQNTPSILYPMAPPQLTGKRECSICLVVLYLVPTIMLIIGIVVLVAVPWECPSGYNEEECYGSDGKVYDCTSSSGFACANKRPSSGAVAGGAIMIILSVIFFIVCCCVHCGRMGTSLSL